MMLNRHLPTAAAFALTAVLAGCAAPTAPALKMAAVAPAAKAVVAPAAVEAPTAIVARPSVSVTSTPVEETEAPLSVDEPASIAGAPAVDLAKVMDAPDAAGLKLEVRRSVGDEASAQNILDPWAPYAVGVESRTAHSVTISWRTDLDTRGIIYFGRSFLLGLRGYNQVHNDNAKGKFHRVTIGDLNRFTSYTFTVCGLGPLGMEFPAYALKFRTKLF